MKSLTISFLLYFITTLTFGQSITGKIINAKNGEPLEFVNLGIIDKPIGSISDKNGDFVLIINNLPIEEKVRFSMIGFEAQTFSIKKLANNENIIKLEEKSIQLPEVIVKPGGELRKVGTTNYTLLGEICGWGGTQFGQGHEIGTEIDLGTAPAKIKSLHLRLHKQSFDSTLFRLHIRSVSNKLPETELLTDNIIITVSQESDWLDVDLSPYNIVLSREIALSLEWVKVYGINKDRLIRMNNSKQATANVLFKVKSKKGTMFTRWGSEAKWIRRDNKSPSLYLTVQ